MKKKIPPRSIYAHLLGFGLSLLMPIVLLSGGLLVNHNRNQIVAVKQQAAQLARDVAVDIERELTTIIEMLQVLAVSPLLQDGNLSKFSEYMQRVGRIRGLELSLRDPAGHLVLRSTPLPDTAPSLDPLPPELRESLQSDGPFVSSPYLPDRDAPPRINVSVRVSAGAHSGHSLNVTLEPARLARVFALSLIPADWRIEVVDAGRQIIVANDMSRIASRSSLPKIARPGESPGTQQTSNDTWAVLGQASSRLTDWVTVVAIPSARFQKSAAAGVPSLAFATGLLLLISATLAHWFGRGIAAPVAALARRANELDQAAPSLSAPIRIREMSDVMARLDETSQRLRAGSEALRLSEAHYRLALERGQMGTGSWDPVAGTIELDEIGLAIFGRIGEAQMAQFDEFMRHIHPDDQSIAEDFNRRVIATRQPHDLECRIIRRGGAERWIAVRACFDEQTSRAIGAISDITSRKHAEIALGNMNATLEARVEERTRALEAANKRLQIEITEKEATQAALSHAQKLEVLGQLTSGVAHDFNNQLQSIVGGLELVQKRITDPYVLRHITSARTAGKRAGQLTEQLLSFARRSDLEPQNVPVAEAFHELDDLLRHVTRPGITRDIESPATALSVWADPGQLSTALLNISINARDAVMANGGRIRLCSHAIGDSDPDRPTALTPGTFVALTVSDDGPGMPPDVLARACEPFFTTKPRGKGTGLGLAMASRFAEKSGGLLKIRSVLGRGTDVTIYLPAAPPVLESQSFAAAPKPADDRNTGHAQDLIVLCVDDDIDAAAVTAGMIRELGHSVICATDPEAALAAARTSERLDILVTDIDMPNMDGFSLARDLRKLLPELPVIFMTGQAAPAYQATPMGDLTQAIEMRKPFSLLTLSDKIAGIRSDIR